MRVGPGSHVLGFSLRLWSVGSASAHLPCGLRMVPKGSGTSGRCFRRVEESSLFLWKSLCTGSVFLRMFGRIPWGTPSGLGYFFAGSLKKKGIQFPCLIWNQSSFVSRMSLDMLCFSQDLSTSIFKFSSITVSFNLCSKALLHL